MFPFKPPPRPGDSETCPPPAELEAYAAKRLPGRRTEDIFQHLKTCSTCLRTLARITKVPSPDALAAKSRRWGQRLFEKSHRSRPE